MIGMSAGCIGAMASFGILVRLRIATDGGVVGIVWFFRQRPKNWLLAIFLGPSGDICCVEHPCLEFAGFRLQALRGCPQRQDAFVILLAAAAIQLRRVLCGGDESLSCVWGPKRVRCLCDGQELV